MYLNRLFTHLSLVTRNTLAAKRYENIGLVFRNPAVERNSGREKANTIQKEDIFPFLCSVSFGG